MSDIKTSSMRGLIRLFGATPRELWKGQAKSGYWIADCILCKHTQCFLTTSRCYDWYFFCFACKKQGTAKDLKAAVRTLSEECRRIPCPEITMVKFCEGRLEDHGIESREEGMRIKEKIKQLGTHGDEGDDDSLHVIRKSYAWGKKKTKEG